MGFADAARAERLLRTDLAAIDLLRGTAGGHDPDGPGNQPKAGAVLAGLASAADPHPALAGLARVSGPRRTRKPCTGRCATSRTSVTG
jgi:hypothetical protein